jgi:nucleotide-binding universal stress UspA family protein
MSLARRLPRTVIALAIGVLVAAPAQAGASRHPGRAAALAQERYYSSYGPAADPATAAALAQERYYSSYGQPEPLTLPSSPGAPSDTPWTPIAVSLGAALIVVAASAFGVRRLRARRRVAAGAGLSAH